MSASRVRMLLPLILAVPGLWGSPVTETEIRAALSKSIPQGETARELAARYGHSEFCAVLDRHGEKVAAR
jgi:hypothetical protein